MFLVELVAGNHFFQLFARYSDEYITHHKKAGNFFDFIEKILQHYECPPIIHYIIKQCLVYNPEHRPTATLLLQMFMHLLTLDPDHLLKATQFAFPIISTPHQEAAQRAEVVTSNLSFFGERHTYKKRKAQLPNALLAPLMEMPSGRK